LEILSGHHRTRAATAADFPRRTVVSNTLDWMGKQVRKPSMA